MNNPCGSGQQDIGHVNTVELLEFCIDLLDCTVSEDWSNLPRRFQPAKGGTNFYGRDGRNAELSLVHLR